ncbi:MAG: methyltransferase domain-containing protein [Armatimonadetes bacterium]|nr:methyltransferase domain-containing protein [Armatimonadota bacterium]
MSIRNNLHTEHGLETYATGMTSSAGDKARINDLLVPGTILEIGCGNGAYLSTLGEERLKQTTAVDMNAHLLSMAATTINCRETRYVRANVLHPDFDKAFVKPDGRNSRKFKNIVCCSVLHELYSELKLEHKNSTDDGEHMAWLNMREMFRRLWRLLEPGGRLIVRDGKRPAPMRAAVRFKSPHIANLFHRFADDHPWFIQYQQVGEWVELSRPDLFEFMTKYFYEENWDVEVMERFGWIDTEGLVGQLTEAVGADNFKVASLNGYTIPWLETKWNADLDVRDCDDAESIMLHSTMLVAFENV